MGSAPANELGVTAEMVLAGKHSRILFCQGLDEEEALWCQGGMSSARMRVWDLDLGAWAWSGTSEWISR